MTGRQRRYRHRDDLLPGAVASAVAYESSGIRRGDHRGLPSPWITFIVSVDGPVRVSGTVDEGDRFDPDRGTSYDVIVAGLHPVAARVEQPSEQSGVQLALHPLAAAGAPRVPGRRAARAGRPRPRGARPGRAWSCTSGWPRAATGRAASTSCRVAAFPGRRRRAPVQRPTGAVAGLAGSQRQPRTVPGRGPRPRGAAEPAAAAHADGGRARALAQAAVPVVPLRRGDRGAGGRRRPAWREVAASAGYADQAHLTRGVPADGRLQPDAVAGRGAPKHPRRRAPQPARLRP